jgi:tetratricopeptide (TPR) repeat protein
MLDTVAAELPAGVPEGRPLGPLIARWRAAALRVGGRADAAETVARAGLRAMEPPLRPADLPRLRADLLLERGLALHALGRLPEARVALTDALALRTANDDESSAWRAQTEVALAQTALAMGDRPRAQHLIDLARKRIRAGAAHAVFVPDLGNRLSAKLADGP